MHHAVLEAAYRAVQRNAQRAENDQRREDAGHIRDRLRLRDHHAHALLRAEEFRDDRTEQRVHDGHVEPGEDERRGIGQLDDAIGLEPRRRQRTHQVETFRFDGAQSGEAVDQHREEREQCRNRHLAAVAESEPDDDQWCDGDLGQALQRECIRHQQLLDRAAFRHQRSENKPSPVPIAKPIAALLSVLQSGR